ncbi:MAG: NAD(P)H-binding protein [Alphaproteobacteria bacterium]|nr:NAD(P)H-binding protein [Alphaproteobacteria bacterium]
MRRSFLGFVTLILAGLSALPATAAEGVLIFGATRNTGLEIAKILVARGEPVTAFVRPTSNLENLEPLDVTYFTGDAMNAEDVERVILSKDFKAVISTLGGGRGERPPDLVGAINMVDTMEKSKTKRFLLVTIIGPGKSISMVPRQQREAMGGIIKLKAEAENYVMASDLDYTIIRPGQLTSNPRSGIIRMDLEPAPTGPITRADLADMVVGALDDDSTIGKVYQTIGDDPLATGARMDRQPK